MRPNLRHYLEIRTAAPANFSPDGRTLLVSSDLTGTQQLYRVPRGGGPPEPATRFEEPVGGAYLPTERRIVVSMDAGGNERHQVYLCDEDGANLEPRLEDERFIHRVGGVRRDGSLLAYACNRGNGIDFDVYVHPLGAPDPGRGAGDRRVFAPGGWCQPVGFSPDGRWLAVLRLTDQSGDNELYLVEVSDGGAEILPIAPHEGDALVGPPRWLPDGSAFYFATDIDRDQAAIARYDVGRGDWEYVLERPWGAECAIDWTGRTLLVSTNEDGYSTAELVDAEKLDVRHELSFPHRGVASGWTFSRDGRWLAYQFSSPLEPGDVWLCDVTCAETRRLTSSPCAVDRAALREPKLRRFRSFDGESIPLFAWTPAVGAGERVPVIVIVHGGPESQARPSFVPLVAYLVARGYGVVVPNVRGSTGYGKRYHHLDDRRKRLDAVRDLAALHDWLRGHDVFDAERAALFGGSYGGYMVLSGLAYQPERWAAGVDIVGVSNLATLLENTSPWRRKAREREYGTLEEDRDFLVGIAPTTHVHRMRAPLFIIHGANDPRVPLSETEQIHDALREQGVPCEMVVYDDEGHGLSKLSNRLDAYPRAVDFLDANLGMGGT